MQHLSVIALLILSLEMTVPAAAAVQDPLIDGNPASTLLDRLEGTDASGKETILEELLADSDQQIDAVLSQVVDRSKAIEPQQEWQARLNIDVKARQAMYGLVMLAAAPGRESSSQKLGRILSRHLAEKHDEGVERFLVRMIGELGNPVAIEELVKGIRNDEDWSDETIRSLASIPGKSVTTSLVTLMLEAPTRWRATIASALATRKPAPEVSGVLTTSLSHEDAGVQLASLDALIALGSEHAMKPAIDRLLKSPDEEKSSDTMRVLELAERLDGNHHEIYARNLLDALLLTRGDPENQRKIAERLRHKYGSWQSLFDGTSSSGWIGHTKGYQFEKGEIKCTQGTGGNIYTEQQYSDFILRFEFKLWPGSNNGLGLRAPSEGNAAFVGMEAQIIDNSAEKWANLQPYQYHGSIYGVIPALRGFQNPVGEWNQQEVRCDGRRVKITLNGHVILDADLDVASAGGTLDGQDHPGLKRTSGHIGFLGHGDAVAFRKLRLRPLIRN